MSRAHLVGHFLQKNHPFWAVLPAIGAATMCMPNNRIIDKGLFDDARHAARLTVSQVADLCGVSVRTVKRWLDDGAPLMAYSLIQAHAGSLEPFGWDGWSLRNGVLFSPTGLEYTPNEINAWHFKYQELASLRSRCERMKEEISALSGYRPTAEIIDFNKYTKGN